MQLEQIFGLLEFGEDRLDRLPETRAVVHFTPVGDLVCDHVIDHRQRKMQQPPIEPDVPSAVQLPQRARADDNFQRPSATPMRSQ